MNWYLLHLCEGQIGLIGAVFDTLELVIEGRKEGNVLFNDALNTYGYMVTGML